MLQVRELENFKRAIDQIAAFVDECNIHFNAKGIQITAFDNAQIVYLEYKLDVNAISGELEPCIFGINISELNKILGKVNQNENISLDLKEKSLDLIINGQYTRSFSFPQKIVDDKKLEINLEKYQVSCEIESEIIKDVFGSARLVSDSIIFDIKHNDISVLAEGLYGRYRTKIKSDEIKEPFKAKFSSQHLHNMLKNTSPNTKIKIKISQRDPFYLEYCLGQNHLRFFLAHMFI